MRTDVAAAVGLLSTAAFGQVSSLAVDLDKPGPLAAAKAHIAVPVDGMRYTITAYIDRTLDHRVPAR